MTETQPFDAREFRNTLCTFTTGVTIITTRDGDGLPVGVTANSFNSVSLDPPMVLWSLARKARSVAAFENAEHFAVHILAANQESLSNRFARSGEDKFAGISTEAGIGDMPLLTGCASRLQCRTKFKYDGGDHLIFVGEVLHFDREDVVPLAFQSGKYAIAAHTKPDQGNTVPDLPNSFGEDFLGYLLTRSHYQVYLRIRERLQQQDIDDASWFVISSLTAKGERSLAELNAMYTITGNRIEAKSLADLERRGLVARIGDDGDATTYSLTEAGDKVAWQILAEAKLRETELEAKLGKAEATALKILLRQLIHVTDPGLPDMWGRGV